MSTSKFYYVSVTLFSSTSRNHDSHDRHNILLINDLLEFDGRLNIGEIGSLKWRDSLKIEK